MSNKGVPTGRHIKTREEEPITFCNVTTIVISNKSNGSISYTLGTSKFELEQNEVDTWTSPQNLMDGKIEFTIPTRITAINIKVKIIEVL